MTKLPILLFAALPLLAQPGTLINLRKPGICPAATAALPQIAVYTGAVFERNKSIFPRQPDSCVLRYT